MTFRSGVTSPSVTRSGEVDRLCLSIASAWDAGPRKVMAMTSLRATATICALFATSALGCGNGDVTEGTTATTLGSAPTEHSECPAEGCDVDSTRGVPYVDDAGRDELVDIFAPTEPGPWPIVIAAHGVFGSRYDVAPWAQEAAARGAVAFAVGYPDDPPFVDAIEHLGCAVRFARSVGADHGGSADDVIFVGHSLGAALGAAVALTDEVTTDSCLAAEGSTAPDAFVGYEGPYDIATTDYDRVDITHLQGDDPQVWRAVDPYAGIGGHPGLVIRLVHGVDDDTQWYDVRPDVSQDFAEALGDSGYDVDVVLIDGATHGSVSRGSAAFDPIVDTVMDLSGA